MTLAGSRIAWFLPPLAKGSGGLNTIFRNAEGLVERGCTCDFVFPPSPAPATTEEEVRSNMVDWFGYRYDCEILLDEIEIGEDYDLAIATFWDTAALVASQACRNKAYFVQDWEPSFFPVSDTYFLAKNSYELGLAPITIGRWLSHKVGEVSGAGAFYTDFCADLSLYRDLRIEKENAICAICQPEKPRRATELLLTALRIVKQTNPELEVYLYGSNADVEHEGFTNLGILSKSECNDLYNRCKLGVSMSTTNPSRIPFEMMAAGLPVVELAGENTSYDLPNDSICFSKPSAASIATLINSLISQPDRLASMSKAGASYMQSRPLNLEKAQFANACEQILRGAQPPAFTEKSFTQTVLPDAHDELARFQAIYKDRAQKSVRLYKPKEVQKECVLVIRDEGRNFNDVRAAIWSEPDQSDLRWYLMQRDSNAGGWTAHVAFEAITNKPMKHYIHLYDYSQCPDASPKLVTALEPNLMLAHDVSSAPISILSESNLTVDMLPNQKAVSPEPVVEQPNEKAAPSSPCMGSKLRAAIQKLAKRD